MAISFEGQILAQILVSDLFAGKMGHEAEERKRRWERIEAGKEGGRRRRGGEEEEEEEGERQVVISQSCT